MSGSWSRTPRAGTLLLALLLLLFAARLLHTADQKTFTVDEPHYIGTALYLWQSGDYHFAHSLRFHPPLAFHLAGLPLLALDLGDLQVSPKLGPELIRGSDPDPGLVRLLCRIPFILLACWGAGLAFLWAREVAGDRAGLLAAFFFSFSPMILANGSLAHSDITVTVFYLQALYTFWRWWRKPTGLRFVLCGLSLGLALISKLSALLLLPMFGVLMAGIALRYPPLVGERYPCGGGKLPRRLGWAAALLLGQVALAVLVIWLGYGASFAWSEGLAGPLADRTLPAYVHSLFFDVEANARGRPVFLFGEYSLEGWWYFLPVAFLLKVPVAFLLLLILAAFPQRHPTAPGLGSFLWVPLLVYILVACFWLKVPLGLRYLLPVFPLLHVFVATRLVNFQTARGKALLVLACGWLAAASLWIHPHYLAYFNELGGGPKRAYQHLVESNLDWGQDLGTLARYLKARGNPPVWLAFFGVENPERHGISATVLRGCDPVGGIVAISASVLQRLYSPGNVFKQPPEGCYDWLRSREPVAQPGYSILVYEIPED
jgi:hypothetical protein